MLSQIKPELLNKWKSMGKLIIIWRCERCYKKLLFYKSDMSLIDMIHFAWAKDHKYCNKCEKKLKGIKPSKKKEIPRINQLLEIYEPLEDDWLYA